MAFNILIVDDSSVMRAMIIKTLRMSGVSMGEVHQAANGREGLDALSQHWIDLAIVDINMPVMNGEKMIECMQENPDTRNIPVVVVSTESSETRIEQLKHKGVKFVHKPFMPETVRDVVNKCL